jgi:transposase
VAAAVRQRRLSERGQVLEPVQNLSDMVETGRMRKSYPSDISRKQFEQVKPLLEEARKKTRPRTVDLYEVFCGVLYVLKSGCQWRMLPDGFPKWRTVHAYFHQIGSEVNEEGVSLLERALKKSGWRGPRETGAQRLQQVLDRGRAEREERGYGRSEGL